MDAQTRLNGTLVEWDHCAAAFAKAAEDAAVAKVRWEKFAARQRIQLKSDAAERDEKLTVQDLNAMILDADEAGLYQAAEVTDALVTGLRKRLDVFAAQSDALRSEIASDRQRERAWMQSPSVPEVS